MSQGIIMKLEGNQTLEEMQKDVAAFEANPVDPGAPDVPTPPAPNAPAPVTPNDKAATPEPAKTPPEKEPAKPDQQPKEAAEKAATETPKAAEPVKDTTDWKAAYKGLQQKYNKAFVEKKEVLQEVQPPAATPTPQPPQPQSLVDLTPEIEQKIYADLEKAPVKTIVSLIREIARNEVNPIKSRIDAEDFERQEAAKLNGLDRLANEGHEWIKTADGLRKIEQVMNENPELWKTKDPYRAALGFIPDIPSKAQQPGPAQSTGLTPILGSSGAVPPATSAPVVSKMAKLEALNEQVGLAQSRGQWDKAKDLLKQMDEIERGY